MQTVEIKQLSFLDEARKQDSELLHTYGNILELPINPGEHREDYRDRVTYRLMSRGLDRLARIIEGGRYFDSLDEMVIYNLRHQ